MNVAYEYDDPAHAGAAAPRAVRGVVLVVDDQPQMLALLSEVLGAAGYTVIAATDRGHNADGPRGPVRPSGNLRVEFVRIHKAKGKTC